VIATGEPGKSKGRYTLWSAGPARRTPVSGRPGALRLGFHLEAGMRVGLFGGSFNPAHAGHAQVAQTALKRLALDRVIWLVTPQNPLKAAHQTAPLSARMASARALARGPSMIVSDAETRIGAQYTLDTLRVLKARFPGVHFVWLMGGDNLTSFHRWRGWVEIMRFTPMAVVARPDSLQKSRAGVAARRFAHARLPSREGPRLPLAGPPAWVYLRGPLNFDSSTALRKAAQLAPGGEGFLPQHGHLAPQPPVIPSQPTV
jgi:nicotinate-nucleotide adenylyltransferase